MYSTAIISLVTGDQVLMSKDIAISQKRGSEKDSLNLIIVKADVNSISKVFSEYLELKVYSNSSLEQYLELEQNAYQQNKIQSIIRKAPFDQRKQVARKQNEILFCYPLAVWRYRYHDWRS